MTARGEINNNPGNIEYHERTQWRGLANPPVEAKGRFAVFTEPKWGIRAIVKTLQSYQRQGIRSVRACISRWAPAVENNTKGYIDRVASEMGVSPDEPLDFHTYAHARGIATAIMRVELGYAPPYSDAVIDEALPLAGVTA